MNINKKRTNTVIFLRNLPVRLILIVYSVIVGYPLIWTVVMSFKTSREILTDPWKLPTGFAVENYINAFTKAKMADYFLNSVAVVIAATIVLVLIAVPAAYALARFRFRGGTLILNVYMTCIFVQGTYLMIPLFLEMMNFHMLNNRWWLAVVYAVMNFPFTIFLLNGFMSSIPKEYEEAAKVDGCTPLQTMIRVMLPMAKPGIMTAVMLAFMSFWNEYPLALILVQDDEKKTLPIGLANLFEVQKFATDWGALFAALVIVLIPTTVVYSLMHKKLTSGLSVGGLKG